MGDLQPWEWILVLGLLSLGLKVGLSPTTTRDGIILYSSTVDIPVAIDLILCISVVCVSGGNSVIGLQYYFEGQGMCVWAVGEGVEWVYRGGTIRHGQHTIGIRWGSNSRSAVDVPLPAL
jgi:hypothetical protein